MYIYKREIERRRTVGVGRQRRRRAGRTQQWGAQQVALRVPPPQLYPKQRTCPVTIY